jgi:hypothetical protein
MTLDNIVTTVTLDQIVAMVASDIVAFDSVVAFVIPWATLLMSLLVMWHKQLLWNFSILQRVHLSDLVILYIYLFFFFQYNHIMIPEMCLMPWSSAVEFL